MWQKSSTVIAVAAGASLLLAAFTAHAFKLKPTGTDDEKFITDLDDGFSGTLWGKTSRWATKHFTHPVHEEVTNRIWGCEPQTNDIRDETCVNWGKTPPAVLYGVQWSDNPPFKLDETGYKGCTVGEPIRLPDRQPKCWLALFYQATREARDGAYFSQKNGKALVYRAHFGDMQFLHAMASWNGETMRDTKAKIMMWAEFAYKVSTGEIAPTTKMYEVSVSGFKDILGRYWGDVTTLFTFGVSHYSKDIPDVAFGSLLHMIEDSFSKSHVRREYPSGQCTVLTSAPKAGRVLEFHAFGSQDSGKHGDKDQRDGMLAGLVEFKAASVVGTGRALKSLRDQKTPWADVAQYLDKCVYEVTKDDEMNPAGPGESFR